MSEPKIKDINLESKTEREDLEEKSVTANGLLCSAASEPLKTALGMYHFQWFTKYSSVHYLFFGKICLTKNSLKWNIF